MRNYTYLYRIYVRDIYIWQIYTYMDIINYISQNNELLYTMEINWFFNFYIFKRLAKRLKVNNY